MLKPALTAAVAATALTASGTLLGTSPAQSLPAEDDRACPEAFPVSELTKGQPIDGLTVSSGKIPEPFTGEVVGVVHNGIAPDLDMILVTLHSPALDAAGAIWAGMSGSPVYAEDGRLIGAASYGLGRGRTPIAGVTPAEDLKALLDDPAAAAGLEPARRVALSAPLQRALVRSEAATESQAEAGLRPLPLPLAVSGLTDTRQPAGALDRLDSSHFRVYRAGSAPSAQAAGEAEIFPGSNIAASLSYGDLSAVATGTTTMVCDGRPVGFGHPFLFLGDTSYTMHGADATHIQNDLESPYKSSNATGPVGVIDGDHQAGIVGRLGTPPETTAVTTTVAHGPRSRTGETFVSMPDYLPDLASQALNLNVERVFNRKTGGSVTLRTSVRGTTADGTPFALDRTNRLVDDTWIAFAAAEEVAGTLARLQRNDFTDIDVDSVTLDASMDDDKRLYRVAKVERRTGTTYTTVRDGSTLRARAGRTIRLRLSLASWRDRLGTKVVDVAVRVPDRARRGTEGELLVGSFSELYDEAEAGSFPGLVRQLATEPRNDEVAAQLQLTKPSGRITSRTTRAVVSDVVTGMNSFSVVVR